MHDRRKASAFILALLLAAPALIAAEPIPKVLDQAKLDRFLAEVDLLTADAEVAAAWNSAGSAAAQEVVIDPNANFASGDAVASVYALLIRASRMAKEDGPATAALKSALEATGKAWCVVVKSKSTTLETFSSRWATSHPGCMMSLALYMPKPSA